MHVEKLFAEGGYADRKLHDALQELGVSELIEIVPRARRPGNLRFYAVVGWWGAHFAWMGTLPSSCRGLRRDGGKFCQPG